MSSPASLYFWFFAGSFAVLILIGCAALPGICIASRRFIKQCFARRKRGARMLADLDKLKEDALALEGVYSFEERGEKN